jgi:hypothetical protein
MYVKESPQEIGFVVGALVGFAWLVYEGARTTRSSGGGNWIFMMICGGIGWLVGWLISGLL